MGGDFWRGAANGLMVGALNQVQHKTMPKSRLNEREAHVFANKELAVEYMKEYRYENGEPYKELVVYVREDGTAVVMPSDRNTLAESYPLKGGITQKNWRGNYYSLDGKIVDGIHNQWTKYAPSPQDSSFYKNYMPKVNHYILYQDSLYHVWPPKTTK